jgi:hypothetical protein
MSEMLRKNDFLLLILNLSNYKGSARIKDKNQMVKTIFSSISDMAELPISRRRWGTRSLWVH